MTPLEIGNDIGGSVRVPPAFCGVYGHKPSESAWPRSGQTPDDSGRHLPNSASALAVMGSLARSAEDLTLAFDLAAGPDQGENAAWRLELPPSRYERLSDFRVAVLPRLDWLPVDQDILAAIERLCGELRKLGAKVEDAAPNENADGVEFHKLYCRLLVSQILGPLPPDKRREMAEWYRVESEKRADPFLGAVGEVFSSWFLDYMTWFGKREAFRAAYRYFFKDWDILLTPVTITNAFKHTEHPDGVAFDDRTLTLNGNQIVPYARLHAYPGIATLCGQPATAFPFGLSRSGMPVGLQAVGPYLEDHTTLRFAGLVGQEFGGYQRPPKVR